MKLLVVCCAILAAAMCVDAAGPTPVPIARACAGAQAKQPFCDTSKTVEERVKSLIALLKQNEIAPLLTARMSPKGNISRLGVPEYDWGANCVHGVQSRCGTKCPTSFANPNGLGASFNMSLVHRMAQIMGVELRALWLEGVGENHLNDLPHLGLDCWSPNINIARDPRWGRNQEVPGEDPYLTSMYGIAYTRGLQEGEDKRYLQAITTIKHWDAYSLEAWGNVTRHDFNAIVSKYDFANTYFPAFRRAVKEGGAKGFMCSYNAVNGVPSCASKFFNSTLRGDWGFTGYVTSDSGAVEDIVKNHKYTKTPQAAVAAALSAGTDIDSGSMYVDYLDEAVSAGLVSQDVVDQALFNSLRMRFELGLFDPIEDQPYWHVPPEAVNTEESQAFNLFATQQTLVLLKNAYMTLPFPPGSNVAVVGPHFNATAAMVGNYLGQICPGEDRKDFSCITSPLQAIQLINDAGRDGQGKTSYAQGCTVTGNSTDGFQPAIAVAEAADYVVMMLGLDESVEGEGNDRVTIGLPGVQEQFAQAILKLGKRTAIVLLNGGIVAIDDLAESAPAILEAFYPGYQGGTAIATALFGEYNPGGKMPVTMYSSDYVKEVDMRSMDMTVAPGRTYRYFTGKPLFPFGWGLSYTTFTMSAAASDPSWASRCITNNPSKSSVQSSCSSEQTAYSVNVTNTGDRAGDEVVQVYFSPPQPNALIRQLVYFERVHLEAGASTLVSFSINYATLGLGDSNGDILSIPGTYKVFATNGVRAAVESTLEVQGLPKILIPFPQQE